MPGKKRPPSTIPTRPGSTARTRTRSPASIRRKPYSIDGNGVVQNATFNALGAETATLYQDNISQANNFQWVTKFDDGGPLRGLFDASFARATSNLQAAQADVEHGLYDTNNGVATSPSAPGCNNGQLCPNSTTGNHGYEFNYSNGGTSGLPSVSYLPANVLSNPAYTTFKSNWAWANLTDEKNFAVEGRTVLGSRLHHGRKDHDHRRRALCRAAMSTRPSAAT